MKLLQKLQKRLRGIREMYKHFQVKFLIEFNFVHFCLAPLRIVDN